MQRTAELPIANAAEESRLRRFARRNGYALKKSRGKTLHLNNQGGYRLIDPDCNWIVCGERFDLTLEDVGRILSDRDNALA
jgi:hypothetical protein